MISLGEERPTSWRHDQAKKKLASAEADLREAQKEEIDSRFELMTLVMGKNGSFTRREEEIRARIKRQLTNKEIAQELNISERTVKFHVSSILAKLDIDSRTKI